MPLVHCCTAGNGEGTSLVLPTKRLLWKHSAKNGIPHLAQSKWLMQWAQTHMTTARLVQRGVERKEKVLYIYVYNWNSVVNRSAWAKSLLNSYRKCPLSLSATRAALPSTSVINVLTSAQSQNPYSAD